MTSLHIVRTPQAKVDESKVTCCPKNTGFQAGWLKNPDGFSQGLLWELVLCGLGCMASEGCQLCLHVVDMIWRKKNGLPIPRVKALPENLDVPLHWTGRKNVFVCPKGDLFHKNISEEFIRKVFWVMAQCPHLNFVLTTKRAKRLEVIADLYAPNIYVGVSVESQEYLWRADYLAALPTKFKKVFFAAPLLTDYEVDRAVMKRMSWVICSPERGGPGRTPRPCPEEWQTHLIAQAKRYSIPFYLDVKYNAARILRMGGKFMEMAAGLLD